MSMVNKNFLWLSLGENCLPDNILERHKLKSFSTPYSSGRSNIDYAITLEKINYRGLINLDTLNYDDAYGRKVVRSKTVAVSDEIFEFSCSQGFEFTHHDPINSSKDRESIERKINRLNKIRNEENIIFLYHHRISNKTNMSKLRKKIKTFQDFYNGNGHHCWICIFYQNLIKNKRERRVEIRRHNLNLVECIFHTEFIWGGNDDDIFWARNDDELVQQMLNYLKKNISELSYN